MLSFANLNILLASICNLLVIGTWINFSTAAVDTMFAGLVLIPLFAATIDYVMMLILAFTQRKRVLKAPKTSTLTPQFVLLLLLIVPIALIYWLTT
ncbi:MAG: hypothetical protein RL660_1585 [Bacteroidota bacterium]|jgi:hypothetical protein